MKFEQSKNYNSNYAAQIINIDKFEPHPNPEVTRMKVAKVNGCNVLVGIDYEPGIYLYFPPGCVISREFLKANNLFRHKELNKDTEKSGYFEDSCRVKMIRLKGFYSEGLLIDWQSICYWLTDLGHLAEFDFPKNCSFDTVDGELLCKKYIVKVNYPSSKRGNPVKKASESRVINEQFRFHYETEQLKRNPWLIKPNTLLHISSKWHGTSGISAYVLCKEKKTFLDKLFKREAKQSYDYLWSSRKVIKNAFYNENVTAGFYDVDIWGIAHKIVEPHLSKGLTLYYEIVGYLPNGKPIQALGGVPYDYKCVVPEAGEEYTYDKHYSIRIYRITYTNVDGEVFEFSARQVHEWCHSHNLHPVKQYWYGFAVELFDFDDTIPKDSSKFGEWFVDKLSKCKEFHMEEYSPECNNKAWHEGVVLRLEDENIAVKVKCLKFLGKELEDQDKGNSNIEDEQCQE